MLTSVVAGVWSSDGVWKSLEDSVKSELSGTYVVNGKGKVVARELVNGKVVKCDDFVPEDGKVVQYSSRAFQYWTVADAEAFERGEAVDPWLPKSNMTKGAA